MSEAERMLRNVVAFAYEHGYHEHGVDLVSSVIETATLDGATCAVPIPMLLTCPNPKCAERHIDEGEFAMKSHHTHACQFCGHVWRQAIVPTVGVRFLPGFKNGGDE